MGHAITAEQERVYGDLLLGRSVLLLGAAGTGKSEFIRHARKHLPGRVAVVAPTGMAAMNVGVGAVTIHSFFQIPPADGGYFQRELFAVKSRVAGLLKNIDYLIVDEVSMVRPDLFDLMNSLAQRARGSSEFFGGICLLLVGDFHQLPPVIRTGERELFRAHYGFPNVYLFDAKCLQNEELSTVRLTKIFRQRSEKFLSLLDRIGRGDVDSAVLKELNGRVLGSNPEPRGALTITPYREAAELKNEEELDALPGLVHEYVGQRSGTFLPINGEELPSPERLLLKEGASVLFTCNAPKGEWANGTAATVKRLGRDHIEVQLLGRKRSLLVGQHQWSHILPSGDEYVETGTYRQFPLRLGYALTVHRTQGKTCDEIILQRDRRFFAHGQLYVALSRARTLETVHLTHPISRTDALTDRRVIDYYANGARISANSPGTGHRKT
ncbi:MAG: AAA family ATPase [Puniceicoccales bacterium]|nr:AAA family ATPase [Puniceicoccales bacterium]